MKLLDENTDCYGKLPDWHKECIDALNQDFFQPERSKREDCKCPPLKRYTTSGIYQGEYIRCRCGALNSQETD